MFDPSSFLKFPSPEEENDANYGSCVYGIYDVLGGIYVGKITFYKRAGTEEQYHHDDY